MPVLDCPNLARVGGDDGCINHMAQICYLLLAKCTLGLLDMPLIRSQQLQDLKNVFNMLPQSFAENQNIVEEHEHANSDQRV